MEINEEDKIRVLDIADSIREIQGYVGRSDYQDYAQREDIREAVSSQLLQIGGAAALLSDDFKERYADIDWDVLKGFQYANFDQALELDAHPQWYIVSHDLPEMLDQLLDLSTQIERDEEMADDDLMDPEDNDTTETIRDPFTNAPENKTIFSPTEPIGLEDDEDDLDEGLDIDEVDIDEDDLGLDEEDVDKDDFKEEDIDEMDVDVADDSYIDQRFTDEDLMEGSSLDDDEEDDRP